nr:collagen-like protein [Bacteroides ovatus]
MPKGPKGDTGLSAYEFWKEKVADGTVNWPKDQTEVADFFKYLKGKDGKDGQDGQSAFEQWKEMIADGSVDNPHDPDKKWSPENNTIQDFWRFLTGASGEDGQTPHVGDNGNWFIGNEDTGIGARGRDGQNGADGKDGKDGRDAVPPTVTIGDNGNWFVDGVDTGRKAVGQDGADGKDGVSPTVTIGDNGNWFIDGVDTGKNAVGQDGVNGKDGVSPTVTIGDNGNWFIDGVDTGKKAVGQDGTNGKDGVSPTVTIGNNGNWFIDGVDTGKKAVGQDGVNGKDGVSPTVTIGDNGNWFIDGVDTGKKAVGQDGVNGKDGVSPTVTIGGNGNWFVNGTDTGKKAVGQDGKSPEVAIGENGHWYINGKDTGKSAFGKDGKNGTNGTNGTNGKSAYELWKEYISSGEVDNPHNPDQKWPADRNKQTDFWDFLTGKSSVIEVEIGKYNVIPEYWNSLLKEYVIPSDGSVLFTVYDKAGKKVAAGVNVSGLPGVSSTETFTTDAEGQFKVTWDKLPDMKELSDRRGSVTVTVDGAQETSARNTLVPNRINVRASVSGAYLSAYTSEINSLEYLYISYKIERQVDGEWGSYPSAITTPYSSMKSSKINDINQPVNEENIDKSKLKRYSGGDTYLYIIRPMVFTATEKANIAKNDTISRLKQYEWDGKENYVGLYFGDGEGNSNDYGQTIYLQDKIHVPELYPAPGFKENSVFVEIKEGVTTLWGEIDTDKLPDFYKTYSYPTGQDRLQKEEGTNIWKHPEGNLSASALADNRAVFIQMRTFINGTGGTVHTGTLELSKGGRRFCLTSAYPNNWIGVDVRSRQKSGSQIVFYNTNEYRGRYAYYLTKEGDQYYLVDFADRSQKTPLAVKNCPADWMD